MEKLLVQLKEILGKQVQLLDIIKSIEKTKNEILIEGKLMDFSGMNENLSQLIEENTRLESGREEVLEKISRELEVEKEEIRFISLIEKVGKGQMQNQLLEMHNRLKSEVEEIKYLTKMNQELIEVAIHVIDLSVVDPEWSDKEIDYTRKAQSKKDRPLLINKII
jgi:hypothetical protein